MSDKIFDIQDNQINRARYALENIGKVLYDQIIEGKAPRIKCLSRTKNNLEYYPKKKYFGLGIRTTETSATTITGASKLVKETKIIDFLIRNHLILNRGSTLRELYYISENWDIAKFKEQAESNLLIEELEITSGLQREDFHMRPEEDGASMFGPIRLREETKRGDRVIHCQEDIGESGYQIPFNVENIELLETDAKFIIAIETGGMYSRLIENNFDENNDAILVHLKGQPARSTRRIIKRMNEELGLPVVVFTDGDPWSYRIFASVAYGAIKSAHLSEYLVTPSAKFIGVQPSDIVEYELSTDKLTEKDISSLRSELEDPRFQNRYWEKQIRLQLDINKKAEQQAFAGKGLDFVTNTYLPERLTELGVL